MKKLLSIFFIFLSLGAFASTAPITGTSGICLGDSTSLTDITAGGTWSSSTTAVATIDSATGVVTSVAPGTTTITYTAGGSDATITVTVFPLPTQYIVYGGGFYCAGGSGLDNIALSGSDTGTYYYLKNGSTIISTVTGTGGLLHFGLCSAVGVYTVVAVDYHTGCSNSMTDSAMIRIQALPGFVITAHNSICEGATDTLAAHDTSGQFTGGYNWSAAFLSCTFCDTTIASPDTTTLYYCSTLDSFGCMYTDSFLVTVNPLPVISVTPSPASMCLDSTLQLHASGAASYLWEPNTGLSCDTCSDPVVSITSSLNYHLIVTSAVGCTDSLFLSVTVDTCLLGVPAINKNYHSDIYPNPVSDELTIQTTASLPYTLSIINLTGQIIQTLQTDKPQQTIDVSRIPAGVYNVCITGSGVRVNNKIVVVH